MPCGTVGEVTRRSIPPASGGPCNEQRHEALKADIPTWQALKLDSYWHHDGNTFEMRACPRCGSSLMQRILFVGISYPDRAAA